MCEAAINTPADEANAPTIGDFLILNTIGVGSTAKVKLGKNKITGEKVAIKIMKKKLFVQKPDLQVKLQREIVLMRILRHPNLLRFIDFLESEKNVYIITELGSRGELFDFLLEKGPPGAALSLNIFRQLIYGLDFLHVHDICHRDIKPENILLDENNNVKIADFGFARFLKSSAAETSCGSPHYAAPEVIKAEPYDGKAADVWSLGVVFYTLLTGRRPFEDASLKNLLTKIKTADYKMPDFPPAIQDLIRKMLTVDPTQRITIAEIKQHPCFRLLLPQTYTVPIPLPSSIIDEPIDIAKVDQTLIDLLIQVGFALDEVKEQLAASEHTVGKSFLVLVSHFISFDMLPWGDKPGISVAPLTNLLTSAKGLNFEKASKLPNLAEHKIEITTTTAFPIPKVNNAIQTNLTNAGFKWFFPNEMLFYGRNHEKNLDITIKTRFTGENQFQTTVILVSGDKAQFEELSQSIEKDMKAAL
ncbi:CAMK family protein kinase [Trichomonas vaginalis G3]|uniref:CAMK family protein kinase n=1 Tax=Trichomonas vaginalis (strain ATCC PRA-98 / G3) TaxID=412133 RepID=A2F807_TRIV3|nr:protein serine/threonine kinase protein [Trichomonas vaginalis G3]EAX98939.1 CAMK family protein kinase [Trichomonas vaginalis G3]KAI5533495.1 protein serine/threonine kinase protein [Trichomonas vaginalis G3]|eukprot:XP_001311869.1 CAMK family protein kinase [Trichomonas vaginalis G3]